MEDRVRHIFERGLGDAKVQSITWTNDDLIVDLVLPSNGDTKRGLSLRFTNIAHLKIEMDYGGFVGQPLLFSAEAKENETGVWMVRFEFGAAPEGAISFECNDLYIESDMPRAKINPGREDR